MPTRKKDILKQVGARIREVRFKLFLKQIDLAKEIGSAQSRFTMVEKGNRDPGTDFYTWFAKKTGCSLNYIILGQGPIFHNIGAQETDKDLKAQIDEADRRAGAAERENANLRDSAMRRQDWLAKAKKEAGYPDNVSFDVVWKEVFEKAQRFDQAVAATRK